MSIDSNRECIRSKYFAGQSAMDESLSDFQETKKSCKGPKPAQKPAKPKTRKVTKRIKGQKDIRTALKGNKNELVSYSKEFDTVCKKSGLDVDPEQLQLAIALSKSLQTEPLGGAESSQPIASQQRVANIRKTLQEYGFRVPDTKITIGKRTKKHRKQYKLLTLSEEEKHQKITAKYSQILFENLDNSRLDQSYSNNLDCDARIFYIAANIPYECMKENDIFYVDNLIEKSTTSGSLLRDWSEIPGRPESPKLFDINSMDFKDIECSQDELDILLSGSIKSVKDIIASKNIVCKTKYKGIDVPQIVIDDEENVCSEDNVKQIDNNTQHVDVSDHQIGMTEIKSPILRAFKMKSPVKNVVDMNSPSKKVTDLRLPAKRVINIKSPVREVFKVKSPVNKVKEVKSPIQEVIVNSKEVIDVESCNRLTYTQQYRSCSPDIFDDESSIMDNIKPINVLSQEHKTKVFTEDNFMDLTQCANALSQKSTQLSQNVTKRKSNDFMEITECIVGSSQPIREGVKEIDLTQSPEEKDVVIEVGSNNNAEKNIENVSLNLSSNDIQQIPSDSQNITDEQNVTILEKNPESKNLNVTAKDGVDLTQSSNEDDRRITIVVDNNRKSDQKECESMDLTQSSNSNDIDDLPVVDMANSQTQKSVDDTIIINEEEYLSNGKVKKSMVFEIEVHSQVFDLTQAQNNSVEYNSSPVKETDTEPISSSFYEDFIHDHSENSKEIEENIKQNNHSRNKSKESNDIDLTQESDTSEERILSPRPITILENIPNNSSLGKRDDVSIDYDEILIEENICVKENIQENQSFNSLNLNSSKSEHYHDIEITEDNNDCDMNSSENSEEFNNISEKENIKESENENSHTSKYDSSKSEAYDAIEIVDPNNDCEMNSSQNSEFNISDKELDYSLNKSRHDFPVDNFDFGGISVLDNVTKLGSFRKSLSEGCQSIITNKNITMGDSFLPEVNIKNTNEKSKNTALSDTEKTDVSSPLKVQDVFNSNNGKINIKTPKNSEYIIKTDDVTPMADYASMSTPQRNRELDKYGLKPFKRKRAIQILTHLYNQTHPTIQQLIDEDQPSPSKKPRQEYTLNSSPNKLRKSPSPLKKTCQNTWSKSPRKLQTKKSPRNSDPERDGNSLSASSPSKTEPMLERDGNIEGYEVTSKVAVVSRVDCNPDDWVFQKREKAKVHSCRVPLHIAFHNYVLSRRSLREAILKYEPVNIDVIHKDLVGYGHRYDPKDLLKFLDKKCITVKTMDNNTRNNKR